MTAALHKPIPSLKLYINIYNKSPLKIGQVPKGKDYVPTIHQGNPYISPISRGYLWMKQKIKNPKFQKHHVRYHGFPRTVRSWETTRPILPVEKTHAPAPLSRKTSSATVARFGSFALVLPAVATGWCARSPFQAHLWSCGLAVWPVACERMEESLG